MINELQTTYIKAIDDLALKTCFPGLICSIFVDIAPWYFAGENLGIFKIYLLCISAAVLLIFLAIFIYIFISFFSNSKIIAPLIGLLIMPLGFAGFFPADFKPYEIPYSRVTGFAILTWSFLLTKEISLSKQ